MLAYHLFRSIYINFILLLKKPQLFIQKFYTFILHWLQWNKDITIKINGLSIQWPNSFAFFNTINEIFVDKLYKKLEWSKNVLDLWWYLWESALYFSKVCWSVSTYEVDPLNYKYIISNTSQYKNIKIFNQWVTADSSLTLFYNKNLSNDPGGFISTDKINNDSLEIKTVSIEQVLSNSVFDWLKMDIEWSEFWICKYLILQDMFTFTKWYIEFHDYLNNQERLWIITSLIDYLHNKNYELEYEDVYGKPIPLDQWFKEIMNVFVLYFEKK